MKLKKATKTTKVKAEFSRGGFIECEMGKDFARLFIPAYEEDYDYGNWSLNDLKDLADAIYSLLKELKQ